MTSDREKDEVFEAEAQRIQKALDDNGIVLSEAAWYVVWGYAVYGNHPSDPKWAPAYLPERDALQVERALEALGLPL